MTSRAETIHCGRTRIISSRDIPEPMRLQRILYTLVACAEIHIITNGNITIRSCVFVCVRVRVCVCLCICAVQYAA